MAREGDTGCQRWCPPNSRNYEQEKSDTNDEAAEDEAENQAESGRPEPVEKVKDQNAKPYGNPPWKKSRKEQEEEEREGARFLQKATAGYWEPCITITMDGAGVLGGFHNGVAKYLAEVLDTSAPKLRFCGTSSGAAVTAALVAGADMDDYFHRAKDALQKTFKNPFRLCRLVKQVLNESIPSEESEKELLDRVNGRFYPSLSVPVPLCSCRPEPITHFESREEFINAVRASCHLPLIGGIRGYKVGGRRYFDGGLSQKFALFPQALTETEGNIVVRVTPWASLKPGWIASGLRFSRGWTYRPRDNETMDMLAKLGYARAEEFFVKLREEGQLKLFQHILKPGAENSGISRPLKGVQEDVQRLVTWFQDTFNLHGKPEHYARWDEWVMNPSNWRRTNWNPRAARSHMAFNLRTGKAPKDDANHEDVDGVEWTF